MTEELCRAGKHPASELYTRPNGWTECLGCQRERNARWREQNRDRRLRANWTIEQLAAARERDRRRGGRTLTAEQRERKRERDRARDQWRGVHRLYLKLCEQRGIGG